MKHTTIILWRHGKAAVASDKPISQWVLSDLGKEQAEATAKVLAQMQIDLIVPSAEEKAQQTAGYLVKELKDTGAKPRIEISPKITELNRDKGGHMEHGEYEAMVRKSLEHPDESFANWETMSAAHKRFSEEIERIRREHSGETVVLVGHGFTMGWYVRSLKGDFEDIYEKIHKIPNGAFAVIVDVDGKLELKKDFGEKWKSAGEKLRKWHEQRQGSRTH